MPKYQNILASLYANRGLLFKTLGNPKAALLNFNTAIALRESLREEMGEKWPAQYQNALDRVYSKRAVLLKSLGRYYGLIH